ncbi:hypothetical protein PAEAM_42270 [Paenibacillus sp. GM1FR]|nr:hypothetical protein PAEAM_42270 [Paenibacillus sp. GM1FR]
MNLNKSSFNLSSSSDEIILVVMSKIILKLIKAIGNQMLFAVLFKQVQNP